MLFLLSFILLISFNPIVFAEEFTIHISDFDGGEIQVQSGDTIIWINDDSTAHTVTSGTPSDGSDGIFDSSMIMAGTTFEHTFDEAGEYSYFCMIHPWNVVQPEIRLKVNSSFNTPSIDGMIQVGEWDMNDKFVFDEGFVIFSNDNLRLYVLVDLLVDDFNDLSGVGNFEDSLQLRFDLNNDEEIMNNEDVNYKIPFRPCDQNGCYENSIRYQFEINDDWSSFELQTFSSAASGFDCFVDDQTHLISNNPFNEICLEHRVWEIAIDLDEIGALPGEIIKTQLELHSDNPSFNRIVPDFSPIKFFHLMEVFTEASSPIISTPDSIVSFEGLGDIELTQAIQDRQNSLPLVADKDTVARIYVKSDNGDIVEPSKVFLYGSIQDLVEKDLPGSPLAQLHYAPNAVNRMQVSDTANFLLPFSWTSGDISFNSIVKDYNDNEEQYPEFTTTFTPRRIPFFWIVPIETQPGIFISNAPDETQIFNSLEYLKQTFPIADVDFIITPEELCFPCDWLDMFYFVKQAYVDQTLAYFLSVPDPTTLELPDQVYGAIPIGVGRADSTFLGGSGVVSVGGAQYSLNPGREIIMAHEINHNLDRSPGTPSALGGTWGRHVVDPNDRNNPNWGCGANLPDPTWPSPPNNDHIDRGSNAVGFNTTFPYGVIEPTTPDFMSYCESTQLPEKWVSEYRWTSLFTNDFSDDFPGSTGAPGSTGVPGSSGASGYAAFDPNQPSKMYYILGEVNRDGTAKLDPILVQNGIPTKVIAPGSYSIDLLDSNGQIISSTSILISFVDIEGNEMETVRFYYQIPQRENVERVQLNNGTILLDEIVKSPNAPIIELFEPNGNEVWEESQTIRWNASDLDDDSLSFMILFTPNDGLTWHPVASRIQGNSLTVDTSNFAGGDKARVRVIATDGLNNFHDDSDSFFKIVKKNPTVGILSPSNNSEFSSEEKIRFIGNAYDPEDISLSNESFFWKFGNEFFGSGKEIQAKLPNGTHTVTLLGMDSDNNISETSITVTITPTDSSSIQCESGTELVDGECVEIVTEEFNTTIVIVLSFIVLLIIIAIWIYSIFRKTSNQ